MLDCVKFSKNRNFYALLLQYRKNTAKGVKNNEKFNFASIFCQDCAAEWLEQYALNL